jgi:methionyl-tRNA formyltransferase
VSNTPKSILFLGYSASETRIVQKLLDLGLHVEEQSLPTEDLSGFDLVISFGFKHLLRKETILTAKRKPINLHVSFLPFNRGMHPNFWSHYEDTPSGVSIHEIDEGIDTGNLIFQKEVIFSSYEDTFYKTWNRLKLEIEDLFIENIQALLTGEYESFPQVGDGTFHRESDLPKNFKGWHVQISTEVERLRTIRHG